MESGIAEPFTFNPEAIPNDPNYTEPPDPDVDVQIPTDEAERPCHAITLVWRADLDELTAAKKVQEIMQSAKAKGFVLERLEIEDYAAADFAKLVDLSG